MSNTIDHTMRIALLGTYLPRKCGIATFTNDLYQTLSSNPSVKCDVIAINESQKQYDYPSQVCQQLDADQPQHYRQLAAFLSPERYDILCIQHEYGIFGGDHGDLLLELLSHTALPVVTTLHTVLSKPSPKQKKLLQQIAAYSRSVVVMSHKATQILQEVYHLPAHQVCYIPHGVPDIPYKPPSTYKQTLGYESHRIILTFGLFSPGKGIEYMIEALPKISASIPDVLYLAVGQPHPHYSEWSGQDYASILKDKAAAIGMSDHFYIHSQFVSLSELITYLGSADIFVTPYLSADQIVSGTLSYAKAMGNPLVSTPYWYAQELIVDKNNGTLVPFKDSHALAQAIITLLQNPRQLQKIRTHNYKTTRHMTWQQVGKDYCDLFKPACQLLHTAQDSLHTSDAVTTPCRGQQFVTTPSFINELSLQHLQALSDDTGIFQHAVYGTPDRRHGYCIDDNARALMVTVQLQTNPNHQHLATQLSNRYLSFVQAAFNVETEKFRNFMDYSRHWLETEGSDDSQGRTLWALATTVRYSNDKQQQRLAKELFEYAIGKLCTLTSPRTIASTILGLTSYLTRHPNDQKQQAHLEQQTQLLCAIIQQGETLNCRPPKQQGQKQTNLWQWFEPTLTYDGARIPQALLLAGTHLQKPEITDKGLSLLRFLTKLQFNHQHGDFLLPIGNHGWCNRYGRHSYFDQQAIEAQAMVDACLSAYQITGESLWFHWATRSLGWFLGDNLIHQSLIDLEKGACYDGIEMSGVNYNQGAESTLAWLLSVLSFTTFTITETT